MNFKRLVIVLVLFAVCAYAVQSLSKEEAKAQLEAEVHDAKAAVFEWDMLWTYWLNRAAFVSSICLIGKVVYDTATNA
jgi:hypothetical protein